MTDTLAASWPGSPPSAMPAVMTVVPRLDPADRGRALPPREITEHAVDAVADADRLGEPRRTR